MSLSKSETLRRNERVKHAATALTAFAVALIVGSILRMLSDHILDFFLLFWCLCAVCLIWIASLTLTLLQAEDEL